MEASSSDQPSPEQQTIVLNIVSPSREEIPNKLTFSAIPISTTIRALKQRIQEAVPARPDLSRQRMIFRGKVLASDEASLKDVFGQEAVNKSEPLSLHLVLSPSPPNGRQQWTPSLLPQSNIPPDFGHSQQTTQATLPHTGQTPGHLPSLSNPQTSQSTQGPINLQQGPGPIPPQIQNAIQNHLAAVGQQMTAHFAAQSQQPVQQGPSRTHFQSHQSQQPTFSHPSFQQIVAQQQQARAAAGQHGLAQGQQNNGTMSEQNREDHSHYGPQPVPSDRDTTMRENQGPAGESFRMAIQSTSISRPSSRMGHRSLSRASNQTSQGSSSPVHAARDVRPGATSNVEPTSANLSNYSAAIPQAANSLAMLQQRLFVIETSLARGLAPPEAVFEHARVYLNNMASQPSLLPPNLEYTLRTRLDNLSAQAEHLRMNSTASFTQVSANQPVTHEMTQSDPSVIAAFARSRSQPGQPLTPATTHVNVTNQTTPPALGSNHSPLDQTASQNQSQASPAPEIYLLSSPTGPHSLLLSPSGMYFTSFANPTLPAIPHIQPPNLNYLAFPQYFPPNQPLATPANQQTQPNILNQAPDHPLPMNDIAQAQLRQQEQQNQARDLARILIPLGGHLWLLIRLFGFVYFFTAGGGHRRAILLGIGAFIVFIANTGAFRPLFRSLWEPVRRHVEGLIPLAAAGGGRDEGLPRRRPNQEQQPQPQHRVRDGTAVNNPDPSPNGNPPNTRVGSLHHGQRSQHSRDPTELADRLLRERHNQTMFRRVERAVALFLASLVPGVGERHIAARDAAEARRVEEERQREAAVTREREEQEERARDTANAESTAEVPTGVEESSGNNVAADGDGAEGEGLRERKGTERREALVEI
ncbi:MAG: hypothetical protein Q9216_000784 [Gyalolechia sp. 2 TL-2023]